MSIVECSIPQWRMTADQCLAPCSATERYDRVSWENLSLLLWYATLAIWIRPQLYHLHNEMEWKAANGCDNS